MGKNVDYVKSQIADCDRVIADCRGKIARATSKEGKGQWQHTMKQMQERKRNLQMQMEAARANDKLEADREKERAAREKARQKEREAKEKQRSKASSSTSSSTRSASTSSTSSSSSYSRTASSGPSLTDVIASGVAQHQQRKQERREHAQAVLVQMAENQRRREAASHAAYPAILEMVQTALPVEEQLTNVVVDEIRSYEYQLPADEWIKAIQVAKESASQPCCSPEFAKILKLIDEKLESGDQKKLLAATNYLQYIQKVKAELNSYADRIRAYAKEHYGDTAEYKQFVVSEMAEDMEKYAKSRGDKSKLELPSDALHAAAFINYAYAHMMDFTIKSEKRKEWRKCYNNAIKKAKTAFSGNTEIMALVAKAPENMKLYWKKYCSHPATISKALLLLVPVIGGFATGHNVFPFIWAILYGGAKVIELLDDFVDEIFTKSKGKQIVWWCWMGITLGLMLTLMIAGFSWGVTLGLAAAVAVGIYMPAFLD